MVDKRPHDPDLESTDKSITEPQTKNLKLGDRSQQLSNLTYGKDRLLPQRILDRFSDEDLDIFQNVTTSCTDIERMKAAVRLRRKHGLPNRLPEDFDDAGYYIKNGLRYVYPYHFVYQSYAKIRWLKRRPLDIFREEFKDVGEEVLKKRFEDQRITINGQKAHFNHRLADRDFICHLNHRHELPVLAAPLKVVHRDQNYIVLNKPPSVPMHPCGRYRHNSLVHILRKQYNIKGAKLVHRLDRLVSGVTIFALSSERAAEIEVAIKARKVEKEYVCRVAGEFPLGDATDDHFITVDEPLEHIPNKIGITVVMKDGKPSSTKFKRLNYNGKTSAVLCKPLTGRMHQIRVHLQYLGYPIVNDSLYNDKSFGPERGKGGRYGKTIEQLTKDIVSGHRDNKWVVDDLSGTVADGVHQALPRIKKSEMFASDEEREETVAALSNFQNPELLRDLEEKFPFDESKLTKDALCPDCGNDEPLLRPSSLYIYLHALRYSGPGWSFATEMPAWALDSWKF